MVDSKEAERFIFVNPTLVSKAGMGEASKENRSRVIANRLMDANNADFVFIPYNLGKLLNISKLISMHIYQIVIDM